MEDLSSAKKGFKAGDTVTLTVYRDGEYITLPLTFDAQPETTGSEEEEIPQSQPNQGQQMPDDWEDFFNYFFGGRGGYGGWGN
jgi:serine protease Do